VFISSSLIIHTPCGVQRRCTTGSTTHVEQVRWYLFYSRPATGW